MWLLEQRAQAGGNMDICQAAFQAGMGRVWVLVERELEVNGTERAPWSWAEWVMGHPGQAPQMRAGKRSSSGPLPPALEVMPHSALVSASFLTALEAGESLCYLLHFPGAQAAPEVMLYHRIMHPGNVHKSTSNTGALMWQPLTCRS